MKTFETLISKTTIPIVLSSDNNYTPFLYTTMLSVLKSANKNTFYDFYLIVTPDFSNKNKGQINKIKEEYDCNISFIDIGDQFNNLPWTPAAWYRLILAKLLPKQYDKCIYLDCDVYVCNDLKQLYNIELNENYVAGVIACTYYVYADKMHSNILNIPSTKKYINSGVLLVNLKQIRNDNITSRFFELLNSNQVLPAYDQDVINIVCYGKIKILPPKYNMILRHVFINDIRLNDLYSKEDIKEAKTNPCIIHYMCEQKPWQGFYKYGSFWWKIAIKTPYKFYFMFLFTKNILNPIPKIKNIIKDLIPKSVKADIKKRIKLFVKSDVTREMEVNISAVKKQLDGQKKEIKQLKEIIAEQNKQIEKLNKNLK
jgi:lipopolysaccharide biosynthesis glycosyltransferase